MFSLVSLGFIMSLVTVEAQFLPAEGFAVD